MSAANGSTPAAIPPTRACQNPGHADSWRRLNGGPVVCATCSPPGADVEWEPVTVAPAGEPEAIDRIRREFDAELVDDGAQAPAAVLASLPGDAASASPSPGPGADGRPGTPDGSGTDRSRRLRVVSAREFAAAERPGSRAIVGEPGDALIPEGGDLVLYGDGGASKTTLTIDLACHLAAGEDWLGAFPMPRAVRVAIIEAEGPAAPFAGKVGRKLAAWQGPDLGERLLVLEEPWAEFNFGRDLHVADALAALEVDVLIAGPVSTIGMVGNGTIGEVREFMAAVRRFRERVGRPLATILVHHDNAAHRVSGAFEGACDTLIQAEVTTPGRTALYFEKCRWSPTWHKQRRRLAWTDGEGFELAGADNRDLLEEVLAWVREHPRKTTEDVTRGVDARAADVRAVLNEHLGARFKLTTGADAVALGAKSSRAKLWEAIEDAD